MTTRVTEGARRERHRSSRLAALPLNARARARALPLLNMKKKRDGSQSKQHVNFQPLLTRREFLGVIMDDVEYINGVLYIVGWGRD